jgi:hypothetical protein
MAASGTVGILRALLTADASSFQKTMKQSADAATGFGKSVNQLGTTATKVGGQLNRLEASFRGDKLLSTANNLTRAITNLGGASRLTAQEQEKVNRQLTVAIEKYRVMGQQAPKAMIDLEAATRKTGTAAGFLNTQMVAIGSAIGSFVGNLATRGISAVVNLGTAALESAGQIADMSKRLGISAQAVQGFQFAAEQSGTTIDAFGTAINKLNIHLAEGNKSTIGALEGLGLELTKLRQMKPEDAFLAVADALAEISDPMERARLGAELLGKGFADISPAIQNDLRKIAASASKMSDETVEALDKAGDALDQLKRDATIVAGSVVGFFYSMGSAALDFAAKATEAKTKGQEFEEVAARIRQSQSTPDLPAAPGLPTLPALGGGTHREATAQEIAQTERQAEALSRAAAAQQKWNEARAKEREAIEAASQGMTYWLAGMKTAPAAIESIGSSLTSDFLPAMQMSTDAVMAFATQGQDSLLKFEKTIVSQNVSGASKQLLTFWRDELPDVAKDAFEGMTRGMSYAMADMLTFTQGFKDGFLNIWRSIQAAFSNILASMLQEFISGFLKRMFAAMAGRSAAGGIGGGLIGGGLGSLFGGGAASAAAFGAAPAVGTAAGAAGMASLGWTVGAPTTAAGGGMAAAMAAFATNPFTIAAAGGLALGLGIWKKGWFRGGQEGIAVNPARDRFLRQFGPPGTGEGSGFHTLAALLTQLTGQPGGGALFAALTSADTMKEFTSASTRILTLLQRKGVAVPAPSGAGRIAPPANPLPALAAATRSASAAPVPVATVATPVPGAGGLASAPVTMNVTIQAWDRADMADAFRTEIIPRFKDALQFNQSGLRTAVAGV